MIMQGLKPLLIKVNSKNFLLAALNSSVINFRESGCQFCLSHKANFASCLLTKPTDGKNFYHQLDPV